jgi:hypothetical protein
VIQISSDPTLKKADLCPPASGPAPREEGPEATSRLHAPIAALFATREARGVAAAKELCRLSNGPDNFFHFKMCNGNGKRPTLTWTLSRESFDAIAELVQRCGNDAELRRLEDALGPARDTLAEAT